MRNDGSDILWLQIGDKWSERSVDLNFTQITENLLGSVLTVREVEKLWMFIDEVGVNSSFHKLRLFEDIQQEGNVSLDSTNTEFLQSTDHFGGGIGMVTGVGNDLHQQRIIMR